jgi:hypothetical protein
MGSEKTTECMQRELILPLQERLHALIAILSPRAAAIAEDVERLQQLVSTVTRDCGEPFCLPDPGAAAGPFSPEIPPVPTLA